MDFIKILQIDVATQCNSLCNFFLNKNSKKFEISIFLKLMTSVIHD